MATTYTYSETKKTVHGDQRVSYGTLTLAGTYTANGDAIGVDNKAFADLFGLNAVDDINFLDPITSGGLVPRFDRTTRKVQLLMADGAAVGKAALADATAAASSAGTVRVAVFGR